MTSPIEKGIQPKLFLETKAIFGYKPLLYHFSTPSGNNAISFTIRICRSKESGKIYFFFKASILNVNIIRNHLVKHLNFVTLAC